MTGQLAGLEAKGLARLGRASEIPEVLDRGFTVLTSQPPTLSSANHFVVDAAKWGFLAMDVYRVAKNDARAVEFADQVIAEHTLPDGTVRSPMRVSEARMTRAVAAARTGELEAALAEGRAALSIERQSVPSLLLPARELMTALATRFPRDERVREFDAESPRTLRRHAACEPLHQLRPGGITAVVVGILLLDLTLLGDRWRLDAWHAARDMVVDVTSVLDSIPAVRWPLPIHPAPRVRGP